LKSGSRCRTAQQQHQQRQHNTRLRAQSLFTRLLVQLGLLRWLHATLQRVQETMAAVAQGRRWQQGGLGRQSCRSKCQMASKTQACSACYCCSSSYSTYSTYSSSSSSSRQSQTFRECGAALRMTQTLAKTPQTLCGIFMGSRKPCSN
jgi:hypothetical protein